MLNYSKLDKTNYKDANVCEVITTCMWNGKTQSSDRTYYFLESRFQSLP
ncbi:hypothetical protein [Brunnivagina elsteri]|nr:hypothetical protein [Calothrix elsteri]